MNENNNTWYDGYWTEDGLEVCQSETPMMLALPASTDERKRLRPIRLARRKLMLAMAIGVLIAATCMGGASEPVREVTLDDMVSEISLNEMFKEYAPATIGEVQSFLNESGRNYPGYTGHDWIITAVTIQPDLLDSIDEMYGVTVTSVEQCELVEELQEAGYTIPIPVVEAEAETEAES